MSRRLSYRILRLSRIALSLGVLGVLTGALAAFGMQVPRVAAWLGGVQLIPAAASFSLAVFVGWLVVTLLWGRVYCSSVCPIGTVQDLGSRVRRWRRTTDGVLAREERLRYRYVAPRRKVAWVTLAVVMASLVAGFMIIPSLFDPYTAYERFCVAVLRPLWVAVAGEGSEAQFSSDYPPLLIAMSSIAGGAVGTLTVGAVAAAGWIGGRPVCNTVCPVGVVLGSVSRYAVFQFDIDTDLCTNCRRCEMACKCGCINLDDHVVDSSRCVVCFDCTDACRDNAISFKASRKQLSIPMMQSTTRRDTGLGETACSNPTSPVNTPPSPSTTDHETIS